MKIKNVTILTAIVLVGSLQSCFTPVNLNYDSARMLKKNTVEIQASGSAYFIEDINTNNNAAIKIGYGISDKYNVKLRAELLFPNLGLNASEDEFQDVIFDFRTTYIELDNKIGFNKYLALSLPLGLYLTGSGLTGGLLEITPFASSFSIDPRLYVTYPMAGNKFEMSIVPKCHFIFLGVGYPAVMPGVSLGFGFSTNLDKWAIRPEIGYDRFLSFGIGGSFNFGSEK